MTSKLFITVAALMLVAVDNGRADDQVSPAPNSAVFHYDSDLSAAQKQLLLSRRQLNYSDTPLTTPLPLTRCPEILTGTAAADRAVLCDSASFSVAGYIPRPRRPSCPIITTGEARALVCGYLAEQYELYCCK
jgi:hypothetical protein